MSPIQRFRQGRQEVSDTDDELCAGIQQVMPGQADDLGGGVFKKRLDKNRSRSIILAKGQRYWVYEYLFAKKIGANIAKDELVRFRMIAQAYAELTNQQITESLQERFWMEICHDHGEKI